MEENTSKFNPNNFYFSQKIEGQRSLNELLNGLLQKTAQHITAKGM